MKPRIFISLLAGAVLSGIGFYFAFRNVPMELLAESLAGVNFFWLLPGAVVGLFSFAVRAMRWRLILGSTLKLSFFSAFHPVMIAFMINSVLPGRIGELARPAIIKKQDNVPFTLGLTTIAAERFLDAITLILLFAWVIATVHIDPGLEAGFRGHRFDRQTLENLSAALVRLCIIAAAVIAAVSIPAVERFLKKIITKTPFVVLPPKSRLARKMHQKISIPLVSVLDNILAGISMVKQPVMLFMCVFYSFAIWLLQAFALYVLAMGFAGISLGFAEMTSVFIIICFFIMLPSVPGYWGLWEAGGVFAMALFGVTSNLAAGFSIVSHVMLIIPVIITGVFSAVVTGVNILKIASQEDAGGGDTAERRS
ncbi:MAG: flippase-like domain-containing protein [Desulfobacteraceae bacterium]|nr:flippase-like domain-containing protein [Desulfobacteraceae bacterium]